MIIRCGSLRLDMSILTYPIQLSNIADCQYVGIKPCLSLLRPMLRPLAENPHATLIIYFMTAVSKIRPGRQTVDGVTVWEKFQGEEAMKLEAQVARYLGSKSNTGGLANSWPVRNANDQMLIDAASKIFMDADVIFEQYMQEFDFAGAARSAGVVMKTEHTIVDRWPFAMKRQPHEPGAVFELQLLLGSIWYSYPQCWVRYTEWKLKEEEERTDS